MGDAVLEGIKVKVRGREFVVPPITVSTWEASSKEETYADINKVAEYVSLLLRDNYPDQTPEEVKKWFPRSLNWSLKVMGVISKAACTDLESPEGKAESPQT